ncbi:PREDICTED: protein artemis-like [Fragaria vesca subsp. vesca]|uniref:protein artemis n=1 Tax=Fragaria vesca subsp. vesca TaxID=101020 RepID=UPI0002C324C6|nr:PREDICTED: protein artemis [Fragaria vesca subsp. vesca]XP_011464901.1 PREDICTED: protein artemis [Fragaria vesca subsp. vesca]
MSIEMPKGLPFSVDTWSPSSKRKRHHFLTHAHKDHSIGISSHFSYPIYSTHLTKTLLLQHYPKLDESLFVGIEVGQSVVIDDPDGVFSVTAFDANHCPGAVMFLFEGDFGNVLHTGDCRLTPEYLQRLPEKYLGKKGKKPRCQLDYVFLDCTFGKYYQSFPSKHSAIQQVINCIWKHPDATEVHLACDLLGQEEILVDVSHTFGSKIYVDKVTNPEYFDALTVIAPEIISQDPSSRFQVLDSFPKLNERAKAKLAEAQVNLKPEPLIIRPSAQWYACEVELIDNESQRKLRFNEAVRDQFGVWHVCYSMHSSREELEWALQLLVPKWVVSTTPSCRAMELNYVKKHCLTSRISPTDPLWKLLDFSMEPSSVADVSIEIVGTPASEEPNQSPADSQLQLINKSASPKKFFSFSPPRKRPPVTLFGRARFGFEESAIQHKEKKIVYLKDKPFQEVDNRVGAKLSGEGGVNSEQRCCSKTLVKKVEENANELQCEKPGEIKSELELAHLSSWDEDNQKYEPEKKRPIELEARKVSCSLIGSSKCFNERVRKLYRSMNVPVPQPLPSLVELMNARKRAKRRVDFTPFN